MYTVPKPGVGHVIQTVQSPPRKKRALLQHFDHPKETALPPSTPISHETPKKPEQPKGRHKTMKTLDTPVLEDVAMGGVAKEPTQNMTDDSAEQTAPIANEKGMTCHGIVHPIPKPPIADNRSTNDVYPPNMLYDYGGDLFQHEHAVLKQLDFYGVNNELLPPDMWYFALRQGTLVMVHVSLHAFNWETHRVSTIVNFRGASKLIESLCWKGLPIKCTHN